MMMNIKPKSPMKTRHFHIPSDLDNRLAAAAKRYKVSVAEILRKVLEEFLNKDSK